MIELDYTNVLDSAVGHANGIPKVAFDKAAESSKHIVDNIQRAHAAGALAFGDLPSDEKAIKAVTDFARSHAYPTILILGIGGSALGPAALESGLGRPNSGKRLVVLDNIDPDFIRDSLDSISPQDTMVNIIANASDSLPQRIPRKAIFWRSHARRNIPSSSFRRTSAAVSACSHPWERCRRRFWD